MTAGQSPPASLPYDEVRLRRLADEIEDVLGIRMPTGKLTMLHSRLSRRLHQLGMSSLVDYEALLRDPVHAGEERVHLFDLATTNKTDFFREPTHFTFLTEEVLPELAAGRNSWTLRLWCAGCSTGQEVYTLAMVLADYARSHPGFDFSIIASDISTRVLREAAAATYAAELADPIPTALRQRYVMRGKGPRAGKIRIVPELRAKVRFKRLNFMDSSYDIPSELDVVFFRNVLIYFERPVQQQVVSRICSHLRIDGYLFIAHSENLTGLDLPLAMQASAVLRRTP